MKLIVEMPFGSSLYGTATPESDIDYKGIYLPDAKDLIMGTVKEHFTQNTNNEYVNGFKTKNEAGDVDREWYSLKYFLEMALKGETITLDMIHCPEVMLEYVSPRYESIWKFIRTNRDKFYTTDMKAYLGYVRKQAAKYGVKGSRMAALRQVMEFMQSQDEERVLSMEERDAQLQRMYELGKLVHINSVQALKIQDIIDTLPILEGYTSIFHDDHGNTFYEVLGRKFQNTMRISEFKQKLQRIWNEYGERARKAEANEGIDWKALHHALRGGFQLLEIYETGDLVYPLAKREILLDVKQGKLPFKEVGQMLEDVVDSVEKASALAAKNGMRSSPDKDFWNDFLYATYSRHIKNHFLYETAYNMKDEL